MHLFVMLSTVRAAAASPGQSLPPSVTHDTLRSALRAYSPNKRKGFVMARKTPVSFDPETIIVLKEILDEAWARLRPAQQAATLKATLAERIFRSATQGEVDREHLIAAALEDERTA